MAYINSYHTMKENGDYVFCGNGASRNNALHMGFELEVDTDDIDNTAFDRDEAVDTLEDILDDFVTYEEDGSLHEGFEIISQPATSEYIQHTKAEDLKRAFRGLSAGGWRSHDIRSCGLHVHCDKVFFGTEEQLDSACAKILYLMGKFKENFTKFSRRTLRQLEDWASFYDMEEKTPEQIVQDNKEGYGDRYRCLNLTNDNTIEFRLWRGTLRWETFLATILFTERVCTIAKTTQTVDLADMTWEDILGDNQIILDYWETVKDRAIR